MKKNQNQIICTKNFQKKKKPQTDLTKKIVYMHKGEKPILPKTALFSVTNRKSSLKTELAIKRV